MRMFAWLNQVKFAGVLALFAALTATTAIAPAADSKEKDRKPLENKTTEKARAGSVDFVGKLGLQLESLATLGVRIDLARGKNDPVALASAARDLAAAEAASGKTAGITSAELIKEAAQMAKYRNSPAELRVVAKLLAGDDAVKGFANMADKAEKAQLARKGTGAEKEKGITNNLYVVNHTGYYIDIYINFQFRGTVPPYDAKYAYVGDSPFVDSFLSGSAPGTTHTWGPRTVSGNVSDFTWNLYE